MHQLCDTDQHYDVIVLFSKLPNCTHLPHKCVWIHCNGSTFSAGLGCAEWKHSDDFSEEDSKYKSNLHQFGSNSPTAYYPANVGHKALEASMSARKSAAFGYSNCKNFDIVDV